MSSVLISDTVNVNRITHTNKSSWGLSHLLEYKRDPETKALDNYPGVPDPAEGISVAEGLNKGDSFSPALLFHCRHQHFSTERLSAKLSLGGKARRGNGLFLWEQTKQRGAGTMQTSVILSLGPLEPFHPRVRTQPRPREFS